MQGHISQTTDIDEGFPFVNAVLWHGIVEKAHIECPYTQLPQELHFDLNLKEAPCYFFALELIVIIFLCP